MSGPVKTLEHMHNLHKFIVDEDVLVKLQVWKMYFKYGDCPLLGYPRNFCFKCKRGLSCKRLRSIATTRENDLETRVRATILYLLGSVFVADSSGCAKAYFGVLLTDIGRINKYAWGELMMTTIYEGLGKFDKNPSSSIYGSVHINEIFMILHVKPLRALFGIKDDFEIKNWPVIKDVATVIEDVLLNTKMNPTYEKIKEIMDACTVDDIICVFHTPHHAPQQFGISKDQVRVMDDILKGIVRKKGEYILHVRGMRGTGNKNFYKKWENKLKVPVSDLRKTALDQIWLSLSKDLSDMIENLAVEIAAESSLLLEETDLNDRVEHLASEIPDLNDRVEHLASEIPDLNKKRKQGPEIGSRRYYRGRTWRWIASRHGAVCQSPENQNGASPPSKRGR
ncbi:hypothetical protein CASFOL_026598 [Castilleja foliolosa]|uniref:Aminotransferase-like plant mobile domain-containing protein n=1 Tax=Castilleja foliolosa TaxID=1961234 RepID=A0ABD3CHL8_9LAMI